MKATKPWFAKEYRVQCLRETPAPEQMLHADTPERVVAYWRSAIETGPSYNPETENMYVILVNTRRRVKGHVLVANGTLDTLLVHPREVFRPAIVGAASAIILGHNHPSGESSPSEADIKVTRDLIRAGQLLKIEVLDHVIIGHASSGKGYTSLRELGYFYS